MRSAGASWRAWRSIISSAHEPRATFSSAPANEGSRGEGHSEVFVEQRRGGGGAPCLTPSRRPGGTSRAGTRRTASDGQNPSSSGCNCNDSGSSMVTPSCSDSSRVRVAGRRRRGSTFPPVNRAARAALASHASQRGARAMRSHRRHTGWRRRRLRGARAHGRLRAWCQRLRAPRWRLLLLGRRRRERLKDESGSLGRWVAGSRTLG